MPLDQKSPGHLEVGVLQWRRQTDRHGNSMTDPDQRAESVKIKETQEDDTKLSSTAVSPPTVH